MPKCKICYPNGEPLCFDTEAELDAHFAEKHPKPPLTPCPESMAHVREFMVEAMLPDWVKKPVTDKEQEEVTRGKVEEILREWNGEYVNSLLTKLDAAGWVITPAPGNWRSADGMYWTTVVNQIDHSTDYWYVNDDSMQFRGYSREEVVEYHGELTWTGDARNG